MSDNICSATFPLVLSSATLISKCFISDSCPVSSCDLGYRVMPATFPTCSGFDLRSALQSWWHLIPAAFMWLAPDVPFLTMSCECLSFCPNLCFTKGTIFFPAKDISLLAKGTSWCSKMHPTLLGLMARWPHDRRGELGHFSVWSAHSTWEETQEVVERNCCQKTTFSTCQHFLTCFLGSRSTDAGCRNCCFSIIRPYSIVNHVEKDFKRHLIYNFLPKKQDQSFLNLFDLLKAYYCYLVCAIIPLKGITSQNFFPFCLQCPVTSVVFPVTFFFWQELKSFFFFFLLFLGSLNQIVWATALLCLYFLPFF